MKGKKIVALLSFLASMSLLAGCGLFEEASQSTGASEVTSESSVSASVEQEHTHEYDNDCDETCNTCDETRETEHTYDNACDVDCNVCGEERSASHEYDNACDVECNICGDARVPGEHDYDNNCDPDCNDCGDVREVGDHVYDNACDVNCNECGDVREVEDHVYNNACDADCNECGDIRQVGDHVYDDNKDDTCNECGEVRELPLTGDEDIATVLWNSATNVDTIGTDPNEHWAGQMTKEVVDNTAIPAGYTGNATSFFKMENMEGAFLYFNAEKPVWYYEALKGKGYMVAFDLYIDTDAEAVNVGGKQWKKGEWITRGDGSNILIEGEMDDGNVVLLDDLLENPEKVLINVWGANGNSYVTFYIGNFRIVEKEKEPEPLPPLTGDEDIATVVWNSATNVKTVGRADGSWGSTQATVVDNTAIPAGYTGDATSFFKLTGSVGDRVYFTSDNGVDYYAALKGKGYLVTFDIYVSTDVGVNFAGKSWKTNTWLTRGDGSNILYEGEMPDGNVVLLDTLLDNPQTVMFDVWGADGNTYFEIYVGNFRIFEVVEEEPEELPPLTGDEDTSTVVWNSATNVNTVGKAGGSWGSTQVAVVDNTAIPAGYTGDATSFFKLTGSVGDALYFTSDNGVDYYAALKGKGYLVTFDIYVSTDVGVNFAGKSWKTNTWLTRGDGSNILYEGEMPDGNVVLLDTLLDNPQTVMFDVWGADGNTYFEIYVGNFRIVDPNATTETPDEPTQATWVWATVNANKTGVRYVCNGGNRDWAGTVEYVTEAGGKTGAFYKVTSTEEGTYAQCNGIAVAAANEKSYYEDLLKLDPNATFTFSFYYEDGAGAGVLTINGKYNIGLAQHASGQWHTISIPVATLLENYDNLINGAGEGMKGALIGIEGASASVTFYVGDFAIDTTASAPSDDPADEPVQEAWVWATATADKTGARYVCNGGDRDWAGTVEYVTEAGGKTGAFYKVTSTEEGTYGQCNGIAIAAANEKSYYEELLKLDPDATVTFSFYYEDGAGAGLLMVNGKYNIGLANYASQQWHTISISLATLVENYDKLINGKGDGAEESGTFIAIGGATASVTFYVGDFAINTTAVK